MTRDEIVLLTGRVKALWQEQQVDRAVTEAWHELFADSPLEYRDCISALHERARSGQPRPSAGQIFSEAGHVRERRRFRERAGRAGLAAPPISAAERAENLRKFRELRAQLKLKALPASEGEKA